jgi:hypothetical protein
MHSVLRPILVLATAALIACGANETTISSDNDSSGRSDTSGGRPSGSGSDADAPRGDADPGAPDGTGDGTDDGSVADADGDGVTTEDIAVDAVDEGSADVEPVDAGPLPYGGPPEIVRVFPQVAVPEGVIYLDGRRFARSDGDATDTVVRVEADGGTIIPLSIVSASPVRLTVVTPADYATRLGGAGRIVVETPDGVDDSYPVFATTDFTFTGKTNPGEGALGNVYRLLPDTNSLPNLDAPCGVEPAVISDATTPCPFTSILATAIDIPDREFDVGFPGLGAELVEWFAIRFAGYLDVSEFGEYGFRVCSDDGSILRLNTDAGIAEVVQNDGLHSFRCADGTVSLTSSPVYFELDYYQGPRNRIGLQFFWQTPGTTEFVAVPGSSLRVFPE